MSSFKKKQKQRNIFTQNVLDEAVNIINIIQFQALDTHLFNTLCDKWEVDIKYFCHGGITAVLRKITCAIVLSCEPMQTLLSWNIFI